jgi:hypothetical protein
LGDEKSARKKYEEFLGIWRAADPDLPELAKASYFLAQKSFSARNGEACMKGRDQTTNAPADLPAGAHREIGNR